MDFVFNHYVVRVRGIFSKSIFTGEFIVYFCVFTLYSQRKTLILFKKILKKIARSARDFLYNILYLLQTNFSATFDQFVDFLRKNPKNILLNSLLRKLKKSSEQNI